MALQQVTSMRTGPYCVSRGGFEAVSVHGLHGSVQHVPGAALRQNERGPCRIGLYLAPQPEDLHVDRTIIDFGAVESAQLQQVVARQCTVRRRAECLQKAQLAVRELDVSALRGPEAACP